MSDKGRQRLDELAAEAQYHRQRADLYRARLYGGRALNRRRLEEYERVADRAEERLRQAREDRSSA
jgi:hypothetical protein